MPIDKEVFIVFYTKNQEYTFIEVFKRRQSAEIFINNQMYPGQYRIQKGHLR